MKKLFSSLILTMFFCPAIASSGIVPWEIVGVASKYLSEMLRVDLPTIYTDFSIDWEYIIADQDDQPVIVKFSGASQYCEVELTSVSLAIIEYSCRTVRKNEP